MKFLNKIINYIKTNYIVVILGVILVVVVGRYLYKRKDYYIGSQSYANTGSQSLYKTQGNFYRPDTGAQQEEFQPDCMNVGSQSCMMNDGTFGNCLLGGMCAPSFSADHIRNDYLTPKPYCNRKPINKFECIGHCKCLADEQAQIGNLMFDVDKCIRESQKFFVE